MIRTSIWYQMHMRAVLRCDPCPVAYNVTRKTLSCGDDEEDTRKETSQSHLLLDHYRTFSYNYTCLP